MEDLAHSRTVLIVDDHQGLISLIQRCLSREGFRTAFAHSGQDALTWLSQNHADLLLLDLQLTDMSGEELINQLAQRRALHVLQHECVATLDAMEPIRAHQVRVTDALTHGCLTLEALHDPGLALEMRVQHLHRAAAPFSQRRGFHSPWS